EAEAVLAEAHPAKAAKRLEEMATIDPALTAVAQAVRGASAELDEAARELSRYAARAGGDPQRLEELDERIEVLRRIARKHGGTLATALQRRDQMRAELASLENHDEELARREAEVQRLAAVGRALAAVARRRQIICITHLPQIAVFAGKHLTVEKEVVKGRTYSRVAAVDGDERVHELARLLSGKPTGVALEHARELLAAAQTTDSRKRKAV